jgi:outer membrane protein OmpA-like peptidoglycan-associated protein
MNQWYQGVSGGVNVGKRMQTRLVVLMALVWGPGLSSAAGAQAPPQFDLNQFRPSELATDGFALSHADGQGHLRFGVQVYMDFARDPLELRVTNGPIPDQQMSLVHSQLTGHLMWSLGLWERLVLFMDLPYSFILKDSLSDEQRSFLDSFGLSGLAAAGRGLGDLYLGARGVLYGTRDDVFQIAAQATLSVNTASAAWSEQTYLGEPPRSPNIGGWFEALATFNAGKLVRIPLNVGYKTAFRQDVPSLGIGNQLTFGAGAQVLLGGERFMITMEAFGRTAAASGTGLGGRQESPVELLGGFKYFHAKGFTAGFAGTGGVTSGYGNPDWRLIGMLAYTMPKKPLPPPRSGSEPEPPAQTEPAPEPAPSVAIEESELQILEKIYFDHDSAKLQLRSHAVLDDVADVLNAHLEIPTIRIEGHTDWTGPAEYNLRLSQRRAASVVRYLSSEGGVSRQRLVAEGFGEARPLVPNAKTPEELARNRRVEFHVDEAKSEAGEEPNEKP